MKRLYFFLGLAACGFLPLFWVEIQLNEAFQGKASVLKPILDFIQPNWEIRTQSSDRLWVESIPGQLKWRWFALVFLLVLFWYWPQSKSAKDKVPSLDPSWLTKVLASVQLLYLPDLLQELTLRATWRTFYQALPMWKWLVPAFPSIVAIQAWVVLVFICTAFLVLGRWRNQVWMGVAAQTGIVVGWTILLLYFHGFQKIDHVYASLYSGLCGLLVLLVIFQFKPELLKIGVVFFQAMIWACYFFSGLEKLMFSTFDWLQPAHFESLVAINNLSLGRWILQFSWLSPMLMVLVLTFQLTTPLQVNWPRWAYFTFGFGLLFHLGTGLIFGIGGWNSPWILMLIFLLPQWQTTWSSRK